jgi:hypothetical protein
VAASEPSRLGRQDQEPQNVAASEPSRAGKQDPEPWDTWQRRSPPEQGGMIMCCRACGSTSSLSWTQACIWGYLVCRVPIVTHGYVAVSEPSRVVRQDPELWDMWQCRSPPEQGGRIWHCRECGSTSSLSWTQACMQGYVVCMVPTTINVKNIDDGPLGSVRAGDLGASTINAKKP